MKLENFNNIGIIGSSGFVGRVLIDYLKSIGKSYSIITGDILDSKFKEQENHYDLIFHFAAYSSTSNFNINMYKTIIEGTNNVIDFCKNKNTFLAYSSTLGIEYFYNENVLHKLNLQSVYNCSKLISEQLIRNSGLNYSIVRFPSLYSEKQLMNRDSLIYKFTFNKNINLFDIDKEYPVGNIDKIIIDWCNNLIHDFKTNYELYTVEELYNKCKINFFNIKQNF